LTFTPALEHNSINYLNLSIHKGHQNLQLSIYRKPTPTNTTIHFMSTHPNTHQPTHYCKNWHPTIFTSTGCCLYRSRTTLNSMNGM
jgi:hypothetical protein